MEARSPARVGLSIDLLPGDFTATAQPSSSRPWERDLWLFRQDHCRRRCRVGAPVRMAVIVDVAENQSDQEHSDAKECEGTGGSPIVSVTGSAWPIIVPQFEFFGRPELLILTGHFQASSRPRERGTFGQAPGSRARHRRRRRGCRAILATPATCSLPRYAARTKSIDRLLRGS